MAVARYSYLHSPSYHTDHLAISSLLLYSTPYLPLYSTPHFSNAVTLRRHQAHQNQYEEINLNRHYVTIIQSVKHLDHSDPLTLPPKKKKRKKNEPNVVSAESGKMLTNSFAYMPFLLIDEYTDNTQTVNR